MKHLLVALISSAAVSNAFNVSPNAPLASQLMSLSSLKHQYYRRATSLYMSDSGDDATDAEGADLAAQFFRAMKDRNISFEGDEIEYADEEDEEFGGSPDASILSDPMSDGGDLDDSDDAILREYDVSMTGEGASLTNEQIYDEMKDRVFESAGAFVELTKGVNEDGEYNEGLSAMIYNPPQKVPDSGLNAGEVVELGE